MSLLEVRRARRARVAASLLLGTVAAAALGLAAAPASAVGDETVVDSRCERTGPAPTGSGVLSLTPALQGDAVEIGVVGPGGPRAGQLSLQHAPARQLVVPENPDLSFLGAPGTATWTLDQGAELSIGFAPLAGTVPDGGVETAVDPSAAQTPGLPSTAVSWSLNALDRPGDIFVYDDVDGIRPLFGTGPDWPREVALDLNDVRIPTWSFTAPGLYRFTLAATVAVEDGVAATSTQLVEVHVHPCTPTAADDPTDDPDPPPVPGTPAVPGSEGADSASGPAVSHPRAAGGGARGSAAKAASTAGAPTRSDRVSASPGTPVPAGNETARCPTGRPGGGSDDQPDAGAEPGGTTSPPGGDGSGGSSSAEVVRSGHFDFGALIAGDRLEARIKDDRTQPPAWVAPSSVAFGIGSSAKASVPSSPAYGFLGEPGDDVWILPQTQSAALPWLGWNTQHETVRERVAGPVRFTLDNLTGPGDLAVFLNDSFGGVGEKKLGTTPGFPRSFDVPLNVHAHGNWAFTEPGTYRITLTQSARLKTGRAVADTATLTFHVATSAAGRSTARTVSPARTDLASPGRTRVLATSEPIAADTTCAETLGLTGAPKVSGTVALAVALLVLGTIAVSRVVALNRREETDGP